MELLFIALPIAILVIALVCANIRVVPQTEEFVIERLGSFRCVWQAGIHVKTPLIDKVVRRVSTKEQVLDFPPQPVITKDNVTMQIDSVVFMRVVDSKSFTYGISDPMLGVGNLSATTLRNIVGSMNFDESLTSRDVINAQMTQILDEATDPWGIKVTRVEVKNIEPPKEIQGIMTKQMRAEREKRQAILEAEAHKESVMKRAEGDKQAKILAAEAERDAQIALAEGRARSIELVYQAQAEGLRALTQADPSEKVLRLKGYESLERVADGNSTKIFMPTDLASAISALGVAGEALGLRDGAPAKKQAAKKPDPVDECLHEGSSPISIEAAHQGAAVQQRLEAQGHPVHSDVKQEAMDRARESAIGTEEGTVEKTDGAL